MKKALIIIALAGITAIASGSMKYYVIDLTVLAQQSGADTIPINGDAINDAGMVAGYGAPVAEDTNSKPFLYVRSTGRFINIGNLAGSFTHGLGGNSYAINQKGAVTGRDSISDLTYDYRPFLFYDANGNGKTDPCENHNLGTEPNPYGWATGINDCNQVVGFVNDANLGGWVWTDKNGNLEFDNGEKQYFGKLTPVSINNSHQIILTGDANHTDLWNDSNGNGVYEDGEKQVMPLPDNYTSMGGIVISNNGDISGTVKHTNGHTHGFYWEDLNHNGIVEANEYSLIGTSVPAVNTFVRAMNNKGQVVGGTYVFDTDRRAFIWTQAGGMVDLNDVASYIDPNLGPAILTQAEGINNNGIIVVNGYFDLDHNGTRKTSEPEHAFVLVPYGDIDESGSVDFKDYSILAAKYGYTNCSQLNEYCNDTDLNQDGRVDFADIKLLADNWLSHN